MDSNLRTLKAKSSKEMLKIYRKTAIIFSVLIPLVFLSSCGTANNRVILLEDLTIDRPEVRDKIPLKAGLHITSVLKNYSHFTYGGEYKVAVGEAVTGGSERMLKGIFREVVLLDDGKDLSWTGVDVVVTPEIASMQWVWLGPMMVKIHIAIKWYIVTLEGKSIYMNTFKSEYRGKVPFWDESRKKMYAESYTQSFHDHFIMAGEDLYNNRWWAKQWWRDKNEQ